MIMISLRNVTHESFSDDKNIIENTIFDSQRSLADKMNRSWEDMFAQPYCQAISTDAVKRLASLGIYAETYTTGSWRVIEHSFIKFPGSGEANTELIADGTWGQFIPPELLYLGEPKVLTGTRTQVARAATLYGVPNNRQYTSLWLR